MVSIYLHSDFSGGLRKTHFCKSDVSAVQGHPKSLILVPIDDFPLVRHSNLGPILTASEILHVLCAPGPTPIPP